MKENEERNCYIINCWDDYLRYKEQREKKDRELRKHKNAKTYDIPAEDYYSSRVEDSTEVNYHTGNTINVDDIINYAEELGVESIDDVKAIQLMLYALAGWHSKELHDRIGKISKNVSKKRPPFNTNTYIENQYNK